MSSTKTDRTGLCVNIGEIAMLVALLSGRRSFAKLAWQFNARTPPENQAVSTFAYSIGIAYRN